MAEPRARFCICDKEKFKPGTYVYLKERGVLTTVADEAVSKPLGVIDGSGRLKLDPEAEKALEIADA
jgi:hypothetical protein